VAGERLNQANLMFKRNRVVPAMHRLDQATAELDAVENPTPEQTTELQQLRSKISMRAMQGYDELGDASKVCVFVGKRVCGVLCIVCVCVCVF
jgi:hypothetical protein